MIKKWNSSNDGKNLSQKIFNKVKPEAPLQNKLGMAQNNLRTTIAKLDNYQEHLQKKHDFIFQRVVKYQKERNTAFARAYAQEASNIRRVKEMVSNAKLSMEQIQIRLNTVSDLGDIVVALSPCMAVIKGLSPSLTGVMPQATASMQDLTQTLGDVLSDSSMGTHDLLSTVGTSTAETTSILEEAHTVVNEHMQTSIPDVPDSLKHDILQKREAYT